MTLTTTQHSALGDLDRFGELVVHQGSAQISRGTKYGFGAKTLQALVDAGHAEWVTISAESDYLAYPRTIVKPGENARRHAARARAARVAEAAAYVQTRFYPPLPAAYGEIAVTALEEYAEYGADGIVNLPDDLNPLPRGTYRDDDGDLAVPVLTVIDALRIGHLIHDFDEEI